MSLWHEISKRDITDPNALADLYEKKRPISIISQILYTHRKYFIQEVKAPLMQAIINFNGKSWWGKLKALREIIRHIKKYPEPTFENIGGMNAPTLLRISNKFFERYYNQTRLCLMRPAVKLFVDEIAHDNHYEWIWKWWLLEMIDAYNKGELDLTLPPFPNKGCWRTEEDLKYPNPTGTGYQRDGF